ncbi:MAG TPA: serine/threonine-protein kinase, partial [Polyangiales bacterium]|nr:serine/threonine-protein kinase [Polyangiales bacterium]
MSTPALGFVIGHRYRVLRKLGEGGMSAVYEAEHTLTAKRAAIKLLHPHVSGAGHEQRLVHEARATSRVQHENVVDVYDVVAQDGDVFLVMELLHGESLADVLARGELAFPTLLSLLLAAMRNMSAAHAVGVVHRDIKPDNILLARVPGYTTLVPKVIDFGISKMFEHDGELITRTGVTMGTPRYVSYEQLLGARDVDARTDVYAFGVILYESLAGRAPYGNARSFTEQAILFATEQPEPRTALRSELPGALARIVERAIAKEREQRWPSLQAMAEALQPFADDGRLATLRVSAPNYVSGTGPTAHAHSGTRAAPRRRRAAVVAASLTTLAAFALLQYLLPREAIPAASPPHAEPTREPIEPAILPAPANEPPPAT